MPLARSRACNFAGYAPSLPTYQPWVLLAPIATMRSGAAEPRDEVVPLHSITSSARAKSVGGTSLPAAQRIARHKIRKSRSASGSGQQLSRLTKASASSERKRRCGRRRHHRPQAKDLVPPCHRDAVAVVVAAFLPHPALAERELLLRVHQRGASTRPH